MPLVVIAETGTRFVSFGPFVPCIRGASVAFSATDADGRSGVFAGKGRELETWVDPAAGLHITSHPDIADHAACVYAERDGVAGLYIVSGPGEPAVRAHVPGVVGPLGPTMNATTVAFRATRSGTAAVLTCEVGQEATVVAEVRGDVTGFDGLPVINASSGLAVRESTAGGGQRVVLHRGSHRRVIAQTGGRFLELGRFPTLDDRGRVAFVGRTAGGAGAFVAAGDRVDELAVARGFESVRGILINNDTVVFYATRTDGVLRVLRTTFSAPDRLEPVIATGDRRDGSRVASFALNPVSLDQSRSVALRVELEDGREQIVRAD